MLSNRSKASNIAHSVHKVFQLSFPQIYFPWERLVLVHSGVSVSYLDRLLLLPFIHTRVNLVMMPMEYSVRAVES